jgi:D-alanyl-lipoteichoic acid acyltransferase DltB (MBOAT superfamily)
MSLTQLLIFITTATVYGLVFKERGRNWFLLISSVLALYWLQPSTPIRNLDFWLPTVSLALTILVWVVTRSTEQQTIRPPDYQTFFIILGAILLVCLNRYVDFCCLTPSRPPDILRVLTALAILSLLALAVSRFRPNLRILVILFILLFIILKSESLAQLLSAGLRSLNGQSPDSATAFDLRWLGFSYLAFRLIHTLRERMLGKLPDLSLQEFLIYTIFFPAFTSGPIDRVERFIKDLRAPFTLSMDVLQEGGWRLLWGVFKKYALADTLAIVALNGVNATQTQSTLWLWVLLYAYAFRLYLDFSGYTDIAIGLGRLLGIKLPENFDRPYTKQNLTTFWNSWHMTLSQWFRAYYFNPVTRWWRTRNLSPVFVIFLTQFTTMLLIGLWHGISWNFVAWGAWHGVGLFIHNRWADFTKPRATLLDARPLLKRAAAWGGVLLTFHYVALGWVWFALPSIHLAGAVMLRLFGI